MAPLVSRWLWPWDSDSVVTLLFLWVFVFFFDKVYRISNFRWTLIYTWYRSLWTDPILMSYPHQWIDEYWLSNWTNVLWLVLYILVYFLLFNVSHWLDWNYSFFLRCSKFHRSVWFCVVLLLSLFLGFLTINQMHISSLIGPLFLITHVPFAIRPNFSRLLSACLWTSYICLSPSFFFCQSCFPVAFWSSQ